MKSMIFALSLCVIAGPGPLWADDEVEVDAEDTIGDSEASQELERQLRDERIRERREAARREREVVALKARVQAKQESTDKQITAHEAELAELKARTSAANQEIAKFERQIVAAEQALANKAEQVRLAQEQLKEANAMNAEQKARLSALREKIDRTKVDLQRSNRAIRTRADAQSERARTAQDNLNWAQSQVQKTQKPAPVTRTSSLNDVAEHQDMN